MSQIPQIGCGQGFQLVAEQREGRRARFELRHVTDADAPALDRGRRMAGESGFEEAIELVGRDARSFQIRSAVMTACIRRSMPSPVTAEMPTMAAPDTCGSKRSMRSRKSGEKLLPLVHPIPFVGREDDGAALTLDQIGNGEVLFFERVMRVHHQNDAIGEAYGVQRGIHRELFQPLLDARFFSQARGIVKENVAALRSAIRPERRHA